MISACFLVSAVIQDSSWTSPRERLLDGMDHGQNPLLALAAESHLDVSFAESLAKIGIGKADTSLPAGPQLRGSGQRLADRNQIARPRKLWAASMRVVESRRHVR